jgi:phage/conjugal plasmid C-4 type zinc finger TraR family protein
MDHADAAEPLVQLATELAIAAVRQRLAPADAATERMCLHCDAPIPAARLRAYPSAVHCVACRELIELGSRAA